MYKIFNHAEAKGEIEEIGKTFYHKDSDTFPCWFCRKDTYSKDALWIKKIPQKIQVGVYDGFFCSKECINCYLLTNPNT